ncbi:MucR family transcriptional regulator [Beijerinckia sp. L45]|uniref:MucR family transcriptional regulator n=1 Tax=Beijerinckia sp. L45 TaxID=1641855 RepID=UPI001FED31F2|nr:MucR family transcriptional regulator [Beijerinckia sp. L45]
MSNNSIRSGDLAEIIATIHNTLTELATGQPPTVVEEQKEPAVSIKKSITPDFLICLEDGKKFRTLKRHLRTEYDMSPDDYRAKWKLPHDYPMVAPAYAASRSALAKSFCHGNNRRAAKAVPAAVATKGRGQPKKAA